MRICSFLTLRVRSSSVAVETISLPDDWAILLYTDGIIDGRLGTGHERLGEPGLHDAIAELIRAEPNWRDEPRELLGSLLDGAERLNAGALPDDVAMLLLGAGEG